MTGLTFKHGHAKGVMDSVGHTDLGSTDLYLDRTAISAMSMSPRHSSSTSKYTSGCHARTCVEVSLMVTPHF